MTIEEMRKKKADLQGEIEILINKFEKESKIQITDISIHTERTEFGMYDFDISRKVHIEVKL